MSLSLYMDENVHGAITSGLRLRAVDVLTVQKDGRSGDWGTGFKCQASGNASALNPEP